MFFPSLSSYFYSLNNNSSTQSSYDSKKPGVNQSNKYVIIKPSKRFFPPQFSIYVIFCLLSSFKNIYYAVCDRKVPAPYCSVANSSVLYPGASKF